METRRFDALTRALSRSRSRRGALALVGSLIVMPRVTEHTVDAKKKKKKKVTLCLNGETLKVPKKDRSTFLLVGATPGPCPPSSPPPPPPPTCSDALKNGDETDVDCGGSCPLLCPTGQGCATSNDCAGAWCDSGTCQVCAGGDCDPGCFCAAPASGNICVNASLVDFVEECDECPAGTVYCEGNGMNFSCFSRCNPA